MAALVESGKRVVDAFDGPAGGAAAQRKPQVLLDRQRRPHAPSLRHVAYARSSNAVRGEPRQLRAVRPILAAGCAHQADDGLAQRALAHAVAADDGDYAALERQGEVLED